MMSSLQEFDSHCLDVARSSKSGNVPKFGEPLPFRVGDLLRVTILVIDANTQRQQHVEGICTKIRRGTGLCLMITILHQDSVFPYSKIINYYAPTTIGVSVLRSYKVRRANIRYLGKLRGKKAKLPQIGENNRAKVTLAS